MTKKTKLYFSIMLLGVVLIAGSFIMKGVGNNSADILESVNSEGSEKDAAKTIDYLEGTLLNSEDFNRGNLRLISGETEIFLRTGRDFSALIGSEVLVYIKGTMDNFELLNIESKLIKDDSFIKSQ